MGSCLVSGCDGEATICTGHEFEMPHVQALLDKGWKLEVSNHVDRLNDRPYVAQINTKAGRLDEVIGHCFAGHSMTEALQGLESYIAEQRAAPEV